MSANKRIFILIELIVVPTKLGLIMTRAMVDFPKIK